MPPESPPAQEDAPAEPPLRPAQDQAIDPAPDPARTAALLGPRLGYTFVAHALLLEALTHPSFANVALQRGEPVADNQRFEFLGDAVLDLVVGERLFQRDPAATPGLLTQRRIALVGEQRLARLGASLGLDACLLVGPGEARAGLPSLPSVLADTFEAVLGAVYLDGGLSAAFAVIDHLLGPELGELRATASLKSPKAALQELVQGTDKVTPRYRLTAQHDTFEVEVAFGHGRTATGTGQNRRQAEEAAARAALVSLTASPTTERPARSEPHTPQKASRSEAAQRTSAHEKTPARRRRKGE